MATTSDERPDVSPTEAAVILRCSERTVWRLIEAKRLQVRRDRGRVYIARADLDALLAGEPVAATAGG